MKHTKLALIFVSCFKFQTAKERDHSRENLSGVSWWFGTPEAEDQELV